MYQKSYKEIFESMRNYMVTSQKKITDFNEGSIAASMLEAIGRELAALYSKTVSNVELYSKNLSFVQFDFERKKGIPASGLVQFSRKIAGASEARIPGGTEISTSDGIIFETASEGIIGPGENNSEPIPAFCKLNGDIGNVLPYKINTIVYSVYGVDSVVNNMEFSGGVNEESENEYSERFSEFIIGLGKSSVSGVRSTALSINGVRSVSVVEHFPAEEGYHFTLFAENGSGGLPNETKKIIEEVICGTGDAEGVRACGINARILPPEIIYINIVAQFQIDGSTPVWIPEEAIRKNIVQYVNTKKIGESYDKKWIYNMMFKQEGVRDIVEITPGNIVPTMRQIIRIGNISVGVTHV
jgi:uncharacterized phage protein gp47/JayE